MIIVHLLLIALLFYWMTVITGRFFISSLDNISDRLGIPPDIAGATLMAAGTSAPELATTLIALFVIQSGADFGVGTIIGSAIFQILVVIGVAALVKTSYLHWQPVVRDGLVYAGAVLILMLAIVDGNLSQLDTGMMLLFYLGYLFILAIWKRQYPSHWDEAFDPLEEVENRFEPKKRHRRRWLFWQRPPAIEVWRHRIQYWLEIPFFWVPDCEKKPRWTLPVFFFSLGAIGLITYGLVEISVAVAAAFQVPAVIIALTILAGGSSLPETVSSAIVAKEGRGDMAISNAIGSNTYSILVALGLPFFLVTWYTGESIPVDHYNVLSSMFLLFVTLVVVLGFLAYQRWKVTPRFGSFLIFLYICYVLAAYGGML